MKIRNLLVLSTLFLVMGIMFLPTLQASPVLDQNSENYTFELNRFDGDNWINVTVMDRDFSVESTIAVSDGLSGTLLASPWYALEAKVTDADFFNLVSSPEGNLELTISMDGDENTILFDTILADPTPELGILFANVGQIADNIVGRVAGQSVYPVDMLQMILESYPEQYAIDVLLQRGMDSLTFVSEGNATLVVGFLNQSSTYDWLSSPLYVQSQPYAIASGGGSEIVSFNTFTLGVDYRPDDLLFVVIVDNAVISNSEGLPVVGLLSDNEVSSIGEPSINDDANDTLDGELALPLWFAIMPVVLVVFMRRKSSFL